MRHKIPWISIKERQPRDCQGVMAIGSWWGEIRGYGEEDYMGIGIWNEDRRAVEIDSDVYATEIHNVSHWAPLPEWPDATA
jgi:hypothetical protein